MWELNKREGMTSYQDYAGSRVIM